MKKVLYLVLGLVMIGVASCKRETVDVTDLLKSVPSSAAGVMVFNVEGILEDAGCKIKDHEVIPGEEMKQLLDKVSESNKEDFMMLFAGGTGIEPKGAVVFYDSNRAFITFALYDVDKFCKFYEEKNGGTFSDAGSGVRVNGNAAVKGAQAWICFSLGKSIDPDAIASYANLASSQSFLVTPLGERLLTDEDDVRGWAMIDVFANQFMSRSDRSMFTLGLGFLFEDAESVKFSADFKKGEMEAEAELLNSKGKPAKYQLPADKVDVTTLKSLGNTCDVMMAFTVSQKLIKKFDQLGAAFGGALFGDLGDTFKNVNGTVGIVSSGDGIDRSLDGVVTLKGDISPVLRDMIAQYMGNVKMDGKLLRFSKGDVQGSLSVAECAEELKGCCLGFVTDASGYNTLGNGGTVPAGLKSVVLKLKPESGSLEIDLEVKSQNEKENILLTMMKNM